MNNHMQHLMSITDPDQLHRLETGTYQNLHFYIFWKDLNNKYYAANDRLATDVGLQKGTDVMAYTDHDFWPNTAENSRENDIKVFKDERPHIFFESGNMCDGAKIDAVSHKFPWYSKSGKVLGIQSLSFISITSIDNTTELTQRQIDCLVYLVKGFTIKQIAKELILSPRTVEHYLEAIKLKFNCYTRADLISKSLQLNAIKNRI